MGLGASLVLLHRGEENEAAVCILCSDRQELPGQPHAGGGMKCLPLCITFDPLPPWREVGGELGPGSPWQSLGAVSGVAIPQPVSGMGRILLLFIPVEKSSAQSRCLA